MKIVVASDFHIGFVQSPVWQPYMARLAASLSVELSDADLFVVGGDIVEGRTSFQTMDFGGMWAAAIDCFRELHIPERCKPFVAVGNHDWTLSMDNQDPLPNYFNSFLWYHAASLQATDPTYAFVTSVQDGAGNTARFAMLQAYDETNCDSSVPGLQGASGDVLRSLGDPATRVPTILFSHAPIHTNAVVGPTWRFNNPSLRHALDDGFVTLAISGHTHALEKIPPRSCDHQRTYFVNAGCVCGTPYYGQSGGDPTWQSDNSYAVIEVGDLADPATFEVRFVHFMA